MSDLRIHSLALAALLATFAVPGNAQQAEPAIVVTGDRPLTEDEALDTVRRVAQPVDGQLARFADPVCPRVTGFQTRYERIVAERIKRTAEAVGARAGADGCVANLFVVIVDDGREFVQHLSREHPEAFAGLSRREMERLSQEEGAARSWSQTVLTNSVGAAAGEPAPTTGAGTVKWCCQGASVTIGGASVMRVYEGSNINPSTQRTLVSAWVVIETGATLGKTLTQLADYSAMRGLAMVRPDELGASDLTILALFEPGSDASTPELTDFDLAYLKSLYRVQGRRWARQQVRNMAESIHRDTEQANP